MAETFFTATATEKRAALSVFFDRLLAVAAEERDASALIELLSDDAPLSVACAAALDAKRFGATMTEAGFADLSSLFDVAALMTAFAAPIQAATGMTLPAVLDILCGAGDAGSRKAMLSGFVPADQWVTTASSLKQYVESIDVSKFDGLKLLTDPTSGLSGDNEVEKFISSQLPLYYANLPLKDKIRVMRGQIALPGNATAESRVLELIQSSGPCIKKLFQLYAGQLGSEKLRKALETLKENNRPFPTEIAKRIIEEELGRPISEVFLSFPDEPIKAGTVAQIYKAILKTPQGPRVVAIKVRRPDYLEQVEVELGILEKFAKDAFSENLVAELREILTEEGDFRISAAHTREMNRYERARSIRLVPGIPPSPRLIVMDWVMAPSFSRLKGIPCSRTALLRQYKETAAVYAEWIGRALSGNGYFHGDPHGGNLNYDDLTGTVGYFDPDSSAKLTSAQQNAFVGIAVAMALQLPEDIADQMIALSRGEKPSPEVRQKLIQCIRTELQKGAPMTDTLGAIIVNSVNLRVIKLAKGLPQLQRAMMEYRIEMAELKQRIEKARPLSLWEKLMFKLNSPEALDAQAILAKIKSNIAKGIEGFSLELGRRYLKMIGL